jgi:hypothetical protein
MFDIYPDLQTDMKKLESRNGKDKLIPRPERCEEDGQVWSKISWSCVDACSEDTCDANMSCDSEKKICIPKPIDLSDIQSLFDNLNTILKDVVEPEEVLSDFTMLLSTSSAYAQAPSLLLEMLLAEPDFMNSNVDWKHFKQIALEYPNAMVTTINGTDWFLVLEDDGWKIDYLQTW